MPSKGLSSVGIKARALERAEQHVRDGDRLIAQQKELIAKLLAAGLDAYACRTLWSGFNKIKVYAFNTRCSTPRRPKLRASQGPYGLAYARPTMTSHRVRAGQAKS
jgi:hypothetical protein